MTDPALPRPSTLGRPIRQIALIVPDLEAGVRAYHDALGIGPWNVYSIGAPSMTGMTYRGGRPTSGSATRWPFRVRS